MTLSGAASATVTADASGNYSFTGLLNGSYTVTPSKTGFTFSPASQAATVSNANMTAVNFSTRYLQHLRHHQRIGRERCHGELSGAARATVTADASGNYTFNGVTNGPYTITPSKSGFGFAPASQNVTVASGQCLAVSFSTTGKTFTLQGTISGTGGSGATVTMSGRRGAPLPMPPATTPSLAC